MQFGRIELLYGIHTDAVKPVGLLDVVIVAQVRRDDHHGIGVFQQIVYDLCQSGGIFISIHQFDDGRIRVIGLDERHLYFRTVFMVGIGDELQTEPAFKLTDEFPVDRQCSQRRIVTVIIGNTRTFQVDPVARSDHHDPFGPGISQKTHGNIGRERRIDIACMRYDDRSRSHMQQIFILKMLLDDPVVMFEHRFDLTGIGRIELSGYRCFSCTHDHTPSISLLHFGQCPSTSLLTVTEYPVLSISSSPQSGQCVSPWTGTFPR